MLELAERVHDGKAEQSVYVLVTTQAQPSVHMLPATDLAAPLLSSPKKPLHFWRSNTTTGVAPPASHHSLIGVLLSLLNTRRSLLHA